MSGAGLGPPVLPPGLVQSSVGLRTAQRAGPPASFFWEEQQKWVQLRAVCHASEQQSAISRPLGPVPGACGGAEGVLQ